MTEEQHKQHVIALTRTLGICPKEREPSDDEIECAELWRVLRIRAYREISARELAKALTAAADEVEGK